MCCWRFYLKQIFYLIYPFNIGFKRTRTSHNEERLKLWVRVKIGVVEAERQF